MQALKTARQLRQLSAPKVRQGFLAMRDAIIAFYGRRSPVLQQFGIAPPKARQPLTTEQKAAKAAKAELTREKRHTMSRKQKQAIQTVGTPTITIGPEGKSVTAPGAPTATGNATNGGNAK